MDLNRTTFPAMLPTLLKVISESHFIAFDLELSGIPTQRRRYTEGKSTLQERYWEVKCAAEQFQILQVGLTCVEEDLINEKYTTRSFNFNLSPLISEGLDIERTFSYSSGAVDFLLRHGYRMDAPFTTGIPYLTKIETEEAKQRAMLKWDKKAIPDINIRVDDTEAMEFMQRIRAEIKLWTQTGKPEVEFYNVAGKLCPTPVDPDDRLPLSRFHQRLTHQLVRAEFLNLETSGGTDFVRVERKNQDRQDSIKESLQRRITSLVSIQVGFRWIADAMAGGALSGFDPKFCAPHINGEPDPVNLEAFARRINEIKESLTQRKRVLVGHNCFMDLVFFYRYFFGSLPEKVEEFQAAIHTLFPLIIDTKYMATRGAEGVKFRSSQLSQIAESMANQAKPTIETNADQPAYSGNEHYHEAGFDSFVTAKVFLQLAANLEAAGNYVEPSTLGRANARDMEMNKLNTTSPLSPEFTSAAEESRDTCVANKQERPGKKKKRSKRNKSLFGSEDGVGTFFHTNMFDILRDAPLSPPRARDAATGPAVTSVLPSSESRRNMIPAFDVDFWRIYGNKLRCYGTQEEVCDLTNTLREAPGTRQDGNLQGSQSASTRQREPQLPSEPTPKATDEKLVVPRKSSLWLVERALRIFT